MASLYNLRDKDLGELAPILYPFINAHRPHSKPRTWQDLKKAGYTRIVKDSFVDDLEEVYHDLRGYYPDENPTLNQQQTNEQ